MGSHAHRLWVGFDVATRASPRRRVGRRVAARMSSHRAAEVAVPEKEPAMTDPTKSDPAALEQELEQLETRAAQVRARLVGGADGGPWWPDQFYAAYHIVVGSMLGLVASGASLLFNLVGSLMTGREPLQLIKIYLTFPLGEKALTSENGVEIGRAHV
jgi:hypothetical protein